MEEKQLAMIDAPDLPGSDPGDGTDPDTDLQALRDELVDAVDLLMRAHAQVSTTEFFKLCVSDAARPAMEALREVWRTGPYGQIEAAARELAGRMQPPCAVILDEVRVPAVHAFVGAFILLRARVQELDAAVAGRDGDLDRIGDDEPGAVAASSCLVRIAASENAGSAQPAPPTASVAKDLEQRVLRPLALLAGASVGSDVAEALTGQNPPRARGLLDGLSRQGRLAARYAVHDLGGRQALASDPVTERANLERLLTVYLPRAAAAQLALDPKGRYLGYHLRQPPLLTFDAPGALAWMTAELPALLTLQRRAYRLGRQHPDLYRTVWELAETLGALFDRRGGHQARLEMLDLGEAAATELGDQAVQALMLRGQAQAHLDVEDILKARPPAQHALDLDRATGDRHGEADTLTIIGSIGLAYRDLQGAVIRFTQAREFYTESRDDRNAALMGQRLGHAALAAQDPGEARLLLEPVLAYVTGDDPNPREEIRTLLLLARADVQEVDLDGAEKRLNTALERARTIGELRQEADAHAALGDLADALDQAHRTRTHRGHAIEIYTGLELPAAAEAIERRLST